MNIKEQVRNCFEEIAKPFLEGAGFNEEQRDKLELKYDHPLRVADLSIDFARKLNMSENDSFEVLKKAGYYDRLINIVEKEVDDFDNLKPIYIDFINKNLES